MTLRLRRATEPDAKMVFLWRNSETVRDASLDSREISWEDHIEWFRRTLERVDRSLLIAEDDKVPCGVLRFDIDGGQAEVSVFLDPLRIGQGLGGVLLQAGVAWAKKNLIGVKSLRATIKPDNVASAKVFEKAGFGELWREYELKL